MSEVGINVPVFVDADFCVDDDGVCSITVLLWVSEEDDSLEVDLNLEEIVETYIEDYSSADEYQRMYLLAHELERMAEMLREKAGRIEDSTSVVRDLFDV